MMKYLLEPEEFDTYWDCAFDYAFYLGAAQYTINYDITQVADSFNALIALCYEKNLSYRYAGIMMTSGADEL